MGNLLSLTYSLILAGIILNSCQNQQVRDQNEGNLIHAAKNSSTEIAMNIPLRSNVLTEGEQKSLSTDSIIHILIEGNKRFTINKITPKDYAAMEKKAAIGQFPEAVVIACMDSRIPVEEVFDRGIGDIFVERVAGNIIDEDMLGSLEYACKIAGAKVILVLGHESCGAIKAAINNEKLGNLTTLLDKIKPAIDKEERFQGNKTSANPVYVERVAKNNILNSKEMIKKKSPILKQMADQHEISIIGGYYHISTGQVSLL